MLWECHLRFYKLSFKSNSKIEEILWVFRNWLCSVWWFVFLRSWVQPLCLGGGAVTFSILILFYYFYWVRCVNRKGSSFVRTPETMKPSLVGTCPEHLSVRSLAVLPYTGSFTLLSEAIYLGQGLELGANWQCNCQFQIGL